MTHLDPIDIPQQAAPANPAAGTRRIFVDSGDGKLKVRTSAGTSVSLEEQGTAAIAEDTATITGANTSVNVVVSGFTAANNVKVTPLESTAGFTNFYVKKNSGSFDIIVPVAPDDIGSGLEFAFDYSVS